MRRGAGRAGSVSGLGGAQSSREGDAVPASGAARACAPGAEDVAGESQQRSWISKPSRPCHPRKQLVTSIFGKIMTIPMDIQTAE